jgi:hypothetical protein
MREPPFKCCVGNKDGNRGVGFYLLFPRNHSANFWLWDFSVNHYSAKIERIAMKKHVCMLFLAVGLSFCFLSISAVAKTASDTPRPANYYPKPALNQIGLYDDNNADIKSGDLNSQDYWWTKFDAMMLDLAIKQHQPEGRIGMNISIALRRMDDLIKKYPKHEGIQKWKAHFLEVQAKINPDASRSQGFTTECPWDEANFAQLWVNVHWMKFLVEQKIGRMPSRLFPTSSKITPSCSRPSG